MAQLPSIELLESTHRFPTRYTFKVIGSSGDAFATRVTEAVVAVLSDGSEATYSQRDSKGGRHVSITVVVQVESAHVVHRLYEKFLTLEGLVMLL